MTLGRIAGVLALSAGLLGCGERDPILPGPREDVRASFQSEIDVARDESPEAAPPLTLPPMVDIREWSHRAGSPAHRIAHGAVAEAPAEAWSVSIGAGNSRRARITADPVIAGGTVFVMDARGRTSAVSEAGAVLWSRDLTPEGEREKDASGGGLAVADGVVYATTGFGRLHAIDAASGDEIWTQRLDAAAAGAPTVDGDLIYLVARDSRAWAIRRSDGRIRWQLPGPPNQSNFVGGPAPAVSDRLALFPFGAGEVVATLKKGGVRVWASAVSGQRPGRAYTSVTDITADPVISGNRVYTGTPSGRLVALELSSGERIWTSTEGAMGPIWEAGGSIFAVNDLAEFVRIDADTGERIWGRPLAYFEANRLKRRKSITAHYGPVLAGGRFWVASGDGLIRGFDPATGAEAYSLPIRGGASSRVAVANGTLYAVSAKGVLHAYR